MCVFGASLLFQTAASALVNPSLNNMNQTRFSATVICNSLPRRQPSTPHRSRNGGSLCSFIFCAWVPQLVTSPLAPVKGASSPFPELDVGLNCGSQGMGSQRQAPPKLLFWAIMLGIPNGGAMRARLLFLSSLFVAALGAAAQNTNTQAGASSNNIFTSNLKTLDPKSYSALPVHPRFTVLPASPTESSSSGESTAVPSDGDAATASPALSTAQFPCEQPAKLFSAHDYSGPLERLAAWFSRKPEIATVPAHTRNGKTICALDLNEKFHLFYKTTVDPVTFVGAAASAGFSQWQNDDRQWGQGAEAYGKRYGAAFADRATQNFFGKFFYPAIFQQDPRYFRQGHGSTQSRIGHAIAHTFVARRDAGGSMPNLSLWAATSSTVAIANLYHPGNERGFGPAAQHVGISIGGNMGFDVMREFWPEMVHKLHLPFRERHLTPVNH